VLYGVIKKVNQSSIVFETKQARSVLDFDKIKEVTEGG